MANIIRFGGGNVSEDIVLLYDNGTENVPWTVSGGAVKNAGHILLDVFDSHVETTNAIDVSINKYLCLELDIKDTHATNIYSRLMARLGTADVARISNYATDYTSYRRMVVKVDLSAKGTSGKIALHATGYGSGNTAQSKVYKVWLEK